MRILQIIETAHRATCEEQDDTVLWFTRSIRAAGAIADVLLAGTATCYAARGQACPPLQLGAWKQSHPPAIEFEIGKMIETGARVFALREDLVERGIEPDAMIPGIAIALRADLPFLFHEYDQVWKW